ncbi:PREDICTED: RNA-binding protein 28 [Cyphomyrmex costatus]|uniref:RNA-binding protein 28 n=1 Tax=Cyphomyrmex costatus TaxID=456900 RepID=A0A151INK9_9HYME|nr:PREDICTED: RNA-binding protein 28 [Cyphomyrmex costatus]KYN07053.1 RNA-binding protein 28 [Cyphomyrmex costatus]
MGKPSYGQSSDKGKKLSWMYRKKAKLRRVKSSEIKVTDTENINEQNSRIIVRNLSFKATEEDVRRFYEPFGEIKKINFLKRPDGNPVGCFIYFKHVEDASKAIFNTNKKEFLGRNISSNWAISKSCEKLEKSLAENQETDKDEGSFQDIQKENNNGSKTEKNIKMKTIYNLKKQKMRKLHKMRKQKKRARIVIRNLAFQVTEVNLREYFAQYGEIGEIKILTKSDGKSTGVAFLQYNIVQNAAKAIHYANMQLLLNRPMIVDWAVPKIKFSQNSKNVKLEVKTEPIGNNEVHNILEINTSSNSKNDVSNSDAESDREVAVESIKEESESDDEIKIHEAEDTDNEDESDDSNDDNDSNDVIDRSVIKKEDIYEENKYFAKGPNRVSNDVSEGRTIFLKNVPFSVKNDELKKCMEQFGSVYYALVCMDPLTEYSRGTAFVKFRHVEDAEKCLSAGTELRLHDQIIEGYRALHRNEVEDKTISKIKRVKDSRNLYLIKEGVVLAKSPAAAEVSVSDMEKRLKLEQWKSQMLRNLNMFVSRVRLAVHNLPSNFDDEKLRQLFKNHSGPKAIIKEARVMRDLKNVHVTGKGKSKEYGFVSFTTHEDALKALRSINNNPNIFSKSRRPIVGFSIENRILVNAKERRIRKSREHNPLWSGNTDKRKNKDKEEVRTKRVKVRKLNDQEKSYAGMTSKLGQDKLRSNFNLKSQAALHTMTVKKQKKLNKTAKQLNIVKKEKMKKRQDNIPLKKAKKFDADDAKFNKLLNNYRNKLKGIDLKKSKWYESSAES